MRLTCEITRPKDFYSRLERDQLPFAEALALSNTASDGAKAYRAKLRSEKKKSTLARRVKTKRATKKNRVAFVGIVRDKYRKKSKVAMVSLDEARRLLLAKRYYGNRLFMATMPKSGTSGLFVRQGRKRLPIERKFRIRETVNRNQLLRLETVVRRVARERFQINFKMAFEYALRTAKR
jgi:hypothetical protein